MRPVLGLALLLVAVATACGGGSQLTDTPTPEAQVVAEVDLESPPRSLMSISSADSHDLSTISSALGKLMLHFLNHFLALYESGRMLVGLYWIVNPDKNEKKMRNPGIKKSKEVTK